MDDLERLNCHREQVWYMVEIVLVIDRSKSLSWIGEAGQSMVHNLRIRAGFDSTMLNTVAQAAEENATLPNYLYFIQRIIARVNISSRILQLKPWFPLNNSCLPERLCKPRARQPHR